MAPVFPLPFPDFAPHLRDTRGCRQRTRLIGGERLWYPRESVGLNISHFGRELARPFQLNERHVLAVFRQRVYSFTVELPKQLMNVRWPDTNLASEGAL